MVHQSFCICYATNAFEISVMFVSENLVFTELHKTAGSHLLKLLSTYVGGEQIGKHNKIPKYLRKSFVLGSIRNPWDWYVSLWGYGCDNKGSVYLQSTRQTSFRYCWRQLPGEMGARHVQPKYLLKQMHHDVRKNVSDWRSVYTDADDVEGFRRWVKLMFDPSRALDIGEGYGFSPFSQSAGVLSYRFFKLFTSLDEKLYEASLNTNSEVLKEIWNRQGFVDAFVRQECLEEDFLAALEKAGISVSEPDRKAIMAGKNKKTNTSSRSAASAYYNEETANIIFTREKFLINEFGYRFEDVL